MANVHPRNQQANPLNTYLYSKPSFTSPQPLAAASGLTIPLSITLSDIKLSAFIILVFSKQKGLTLVFRNDPLESLKVSSTFDSIQFVRDYLQKTIEQQLRNLMMEELPAIIHRLSLQLWCPDQANKGTQTPQDDLHEQGVDPFAVPPLDPVDAHGNLLDPNAVSELMVNGGGEMQSLFSQKNLLRLAALTDCHRTISLFTPGIRDVVFRAWSGYGDRSEPTTPLLITPSLTRTYSLPTGGCTTYTFSDSSSAVHDSIPSRASVISLGSVASGSSYGPGHRARPGRKKKNRVVNLRRPKPEMGSIDGLLEGDSDIASVQVPSSEPHEESESQTDKLSTSPLGHVLENDHTSATCPTHSPQLYEKQMASPTNKAASEPPAPFLEPVPAKTAAGSKNWVDPIRGMPRNNSDTSSILEQAWIMKMAGEIASRVYDEKSRRLSMWDEPEHAPPPAYEATPL